ncbi:MAG: radical SAM protein [Candidatus Omnitrophota bacterium]|jgi:pyruvate-formate lyase-activating enzyme
MSILPDLKTGVRKIKGETAILNVTSFCNASCLFCSEGRHTHPVNVDLSVIKQTVLKLKSMGIEAINFMGGETTLREDLEEILRFIHRQGIKTYLVTNGIKFADRVFARRILKYLDSIEISVHAHDRSMFRALMGVDAFEELIQGIKNIRDYSSTMVIFFNFIPNSVNFPKILAVFKLLKKLLGSRDFLVHIKTLNLEGRVFENPGLMPDYNEFAGYLQRALKYALNNGIGVVISRFPLCLYSGFEHLCLELPLKLRKNKMFFNNNQLLGKNTSFKPGPTVNYNQNAHNHKECLKCSLAMICPGIDTQYLKVRNNTGFLSAQDKPLSKIIKKMAQDSLFFKLDHYYHEYPFELKLDYPSLIPGKRAKI